MWHWRVHAQGDLGSLDGLLTVIDYVLDRLPPLPGQGRTRHVAEGMLDRVQEQVLTVGPRPDHPSLVLARHLHVRGRRLSRRAASERDRHVLKPLAAGKDLMDHALVRLCRDGGSTRRLAADARLTRAKAVVDGGFRRYRACSQGDDRERSGGTYPHAELNSEMRPYHGLHA